MTGFGIAVAVVLLLWCALLYVPFRWRPVGRCLIIEKSLAAGYVPFLAVIASTGRRPPAYPGTHSKAVAP